MNRNYAYTLTLFGYFSLLILLLLWPTLLSPPQQIPVAVVLGITLIPILLPLRGLLHGRVTSFVWSAYLSLFYFVHGVTETGAGSDEMFLAMLEIVSSMLLFFGIISFLKSTSKNTT